MLSIPMQMMIVAVAGWVNREQQSIIDYQGEEIRVYRELCGKRRLRFNDDQRRRLAAKGRSLGRRALREIGTIVKPDTIIRWYRELIARKYDGSGKRRPRPVPELSLTGSPLSASDWRGRGQPGSSRMSGFWHGSVRRC